MSQEQDLSNNNDKKMSRGLKNRHVQLIALGGTIGTGLFLGSGESISLAGPSILLAYTITGIMCFFIMRALGTLLPRFIINSFIEPIAKFLGTTTGFRRFGLIGCVDYWSDCCHSS